jgi:hypothetical protein
VTVAAEPITVAMFGLSRLPAARLTSRAFAAALLAVSAAVTVVAALRLPASTTVNLGAVLLAVDTLVLGLSQYWALRQENSLDHLYERIHLGNLMRVEYEQSRPDSRDRYVGAAALHGETRATRARFLFYVFTEMDNLEYAIEKYRHGFMSELLADRALRTFVARLRRVRFRDAVSSHYRDAPYTPETRRVIEMMLRIAPGLDDVDEALFAPPEPSEATPRAGDPAGTTDVHG